MFDGTNTIGVRTKSDKVEEDHDHLLMERILDGNRNPIQALVDPILDQASYVYNTYLYSSGVMVICMAFWGFYPSFVRFRHQHLFRYRRAQLTFRRGLFATPHMPKWDKAYLQRIAIPPVPKASITFAAPITGNGADGAAEGTAVSVVEPAPQDLAVRQAPSDALYQVTELHSTRSRPGSFASGDVAKSEAALSSALEQINKDFYGSKSNLFSATIRAEAEDLDLHERLLAAVGAAKAMVVLKEDHHTLRSIPEDWEIWWVSEQEARRRRFCRFWIIGLLCARAFEDLMDMPDMPDMIN